jgi:DNA-binding PadR family transcriptional regulator
LVAGLDRSVSGDSRLGIPMRTADPCDLTWQREGRPIELAITADIPEILRGNEAGYRQVRYELAIEFGDQLRLSAETLWLTRANSHQNNEQPSLFPEDYPQRRVISSRTPKGWRKVVSKTDGGNDYFRSEKSQWNNMFRLGPTKSALANLPEDESRFPIAIWFKQLLMEGVYVLSLNAENMRLPSRAGTPSEILPDGSNLPWVIYALERSGSARLEDWLKHMRTSLPDLVAIRTHEKPEDRSRYLEVEYGSGLKAPSWLLSDGTLRMIALTLLAYAKDPPKILLVEEPENGIHPRAMETVIQSLSSVYHSQVFCATHSPIVLSLLKPDQLLCFAKTDAGAVDIVSGTHHPALREWKAAVHLGDMLAMGVLG